MGPPAALRREKLFLAGQNRGIFWETDKAIACKKCIGTVKRWGVDVRSQRNNIKKEK